MRKRRIFIPAVLAMAGCASQPVMLEIEEGALVVEGFGTVSGTGLRYSRGIVRDGEAAATWSGKVSLRRNAPAPVATEAVAPVPPAPPSE